MVPNYPLLKVSILSWMIDVFFFGVFQVSESKREASVESETRDGEGACLVLLSRFVFAGLRLLRNSKMKV